MSTLQAPAEGPPRAALRARDAAQWLNERLRPTTPFSPRTLWRLTSRGQIPTLRVSRQCWYLTDQLELWIRAGGGKAHSTRSTDDDRDDARGRSA